VIVVARVVKPHGIRGEVVLESFSDVEGRLEDSQSFWILKGDQAVRELVVESSRMIQGRHAIKFVGIDTRTDAEKLRNIELGIPDEAIGSLPPDHFFVHDLVGATVYLMNGQEVGVVTGVTKTAGMDLLEVGEKILIPFVAEICVEVDVEKKRVVINPPEGLLQLNAR
jgi:16S rRNA processing protein RimM